MDGPARILVFTGAGKGKTTAALGLALRSLAHGKKVLLAQFCKTAATGEIDFFATVPDIRILRSARGMTPGPDHPAFAAHIEAATALFRECAAAAPEFDVVIQDEICGAVARGLLREDEVVAFAESLPAGKILVMTGRGASPRLIALADTATDMTCLKHGLGKGIKAQKGVEL